MDLSSCLSEHSVTPRFNLCTCAVLNWRNREVVFGKSVCTVPAISQFISRLLCEALTRLWHLKCFSLPSWLKEDQTAIDSATSQRSHMANFSFEIWTKHLNRSLFKCRYVYFSSPHLDSKLHEGRDHSVCFLETTSIVPVPSTLHGQSSNKFIMILI